MNGSSVLDISMDTSAFLWTVGPAGHLYSSRTSKHLSLDTKRHEALPCMVFRHSLLFGNRGHGLLSSNMAAAYQKN